jgi:hypothetical protein
VKAQRYRINSDTSFELCLLMSESTFTMHASSDVYSLKKFASRRWYKLLLAPASTPTAALA